MIRKYFYIGSSVHLCARRYILVTFICTLSLCAWQEVQLSILKCTSQHIIMPVEWNENPRSAVWCAWLSRSRCRWHHCYKFILQNLYNANYILQKWCDVKTQIETRANRNIVMVIFLYVPCKQMTKYILLGTQYHFRLHWARISFWIKLQ